MTTWDLDRMRYAIRKCTGKFDTTQLPDQSDPNTPINISNPAGIDDYINDFYLYDLPEDMRTLKLKDFYIFNTIPNCGTYSLPQYIKNVEPPIYIDNYQFAWYQWPDVFYRIWPELNFIDRNLFTPNGSTQTFTFTLTQTPVQQGTVVIGLQPNLDGTPSPKLETFTDQDQPIPLDIPQSQFFVNPAPLIGNLGGTGTVDYLTGVVNLTYATAPPSGTNNSSHYHPYVASRPRDIMFYQQQLFLRPIPNDTYAVKVMSYFMPTVVLNAATNSPSRPLFDVTGPNKGNIVAFGASGTDLPQFNEWWQLIVYGAAVKIFLEDGEHEEAARYQQYYDRQRLLAQRESLKQLANQRIQTPYAENVGGPAFPIFPIY